LRAYRAGQALVGALKDKDVLVRREAAMSLAWCGGRTAVNPLISAMEDEDWVVRQGAWVSLTNLTGMEFAFDAVVNERDRDGRIAVWRRWWQKVGPDEAPVDVYKLLEGFPRLGEENFALGCSVTATSTYKGPVGALTDGDLGGVYWQTKNVAYPQSCTVDLGRARQVSCVVVHQYSKSFGLNDYELLVSIDGHRFTRVIREEKRSEARLVLNFATQRARYIRITSHASANRTYPTTFYEIEVRPKPYMEASGRTDFVRFERGVRALGVLGGQEACRAIVKVLKGYVTRSSDDFAEKAFVQTGLRALGRLGFQDGAGLLISFLDHPKWARYAADALGDCPSQPTCEALINAYPQYARDIKRAAPRRLPKDDHPGLEPADRMYETPYAIAAALCRMPWQGQENIETLRKMVPLLAANIPSDFDGAMLYEPEAHQLVTAYLLEKAGLRTVACEAIFKVLGCEWDQTLLDSEAGKALVVLASVSPGDIPFAATWIPSLCVTKDTAPRLVKLLAHENGWVRINSAKALMFTNVSDAVRPIGQLLATSKAEGEYGYFGSYLFTTLTKQGQAEYDDKPPRWRQAYARALGRLNGKAYVPLLAEILFDDKNVLEVQQAALFALDELGTPQAVEAMERAEQTHPFHSLRLFAREFLWRRGVLDQRLPEPADQGGRGVAAEAIIETGKTGRPGKSGQPEGIVFIKGDNSMPNDFQIDIWRQTYSTTDSGPAYRMGQNLFVLSPARSDGEVVQLTHFESGYVADCEVSWDGDTVVFSHRGGADNPWWHVWEIGVDGTGLRQLTSGPYHDVGPVYMPDGRILFSSSRLGMRDEYHGYYATGLTVMNSDGGDVHCIGVNLGRDNEPAFLNDGRIVFGRLELFYSRLKTEIVLEAVFPDGTKNVTLYGPEKRALWRQVTVDSRENWWGEVAPRHRVLRLTQPQPFGNGQIVCSTTAGLTVVGPGRFKERFLRDSKDMAVTSPYPLGDGRLLCAASPRSFDRKAVDLGLYTMECDSGELTMLYNDPTKADFEARPIVARSRPDVLVEDPLARSSCFTGRFFCSSVKMTQHQDVIDRGKLVRVIEGLPSVVRHHTHRSLKGEAWKNHTGTHARVLGTVPLGVDGAFHVEVPADRLIHVQVLDSDRRVVGNQQIWMYARPGEKRSCVGCHERPDSTRLPSGFSPMAQIEPVKCLPTGGEFNYRAKFWNKGTLTDEGEERTRTVRAVNLMGRY
ncbi:MAG: HEAT repeat domain-containing protein, partial [Phycisphaeraceae bacterium]|nr:HEAT repeat domain-containing protein [Phycisphaeraceae bacterium]